MAKLIMEIGEEREWKRVLKRREISKNEGSKEAMLVSLWR